MFGIHPDIIAGLLLLGFVGAAAGMLWAFSFRPRPDPRHCVRCGAVWADSAICADCWQLFDEMLEAAGEGEAKNIAAHKWQEAIDAN